jgi:hypothetical protein
LTEVPTGATLAPIQELAPLPCWCFLILILFYFLGPEPDRQFTGSRNVPQSGQSLHQVSTQLRTANFEMALLEMINCDTRYFLEIALQASLVSKTVL